jgi:hypothetical protein
VAAASAGARRSGGLILPGHARCAGGAADVNSLNNLSGLNDLYSLISSKKLTELDVSINPDIKMTYPGLLMWDGSSKIHYFIDFGHPLSWRLWRAHNIKKIKTDELGINVPIS